MKYSFINILKIVITLLVLNQCLSDKLIKDTNYPIIVKYATKTTAGLTVELRFKFPMRESSNSSNKISGIGYNQFIGVIFPSASGLTFTSTTVGCRLRTSTKTYNVTFRPPTTLSNMTTTANSNYIYCQLTDTTVTTLPADTTFTLTLTFPVAFTTNYFANIGLFTSTSNTPDQVIIDYNPSFGSIGLYEDFTLTDRNRVAELSSPGSTLATITSPSSTTNTSLYPYFTIDISVVVEITNTWLPFSDDYVFLFKFDSDSFSAPNSIKSDKVNASSDIANESALKTTITLTTYEPGIVIITGIDGNDLYPRRKFKLTFSGLKTTDKKLDSQTQCELWVLYKNTYSIVSYSKINMDKVNKISLSGDVHHNEYYNLFDGMGWPMEISFKTAYDMPEGGYVVVRHRDFSKAVNSFVFVASSCDFSEFTSLEQNFGKRWNCYPLRNDFNFTDDAAGSSGNKEAHGFFFKMSSISASVDFYKLKVWGFAENCYNSADSTNFYRTRLAFTIRVFKTAENSIKEEKRFFDNTNNYVIAEQLTLEGPICYPLQLHNKTDLNSNLLTLAANNILASTTRVVGIEITSIFVFKAPTTESSLSTNTIANFSANIAPVLPTTFANYSTTLAYTQERYVFGSTSDLADTSLLFSGNVGINVDSNGAALDIAAYIPTECIDVANATDKFTGLTDIRIKWYFSRFWFVQNKAISDTTTGCQLSWKIPSTTDGAGGTALNFNKKTILFAENYATTSTVTGTYDNALTTLISKDINMRSSAPANVARAANIDTSVSQINTSSTSLTGTDLQYVISSSSMTGFTTLGLLGEACNTSKLAKVSDATYGSAISIIVYTNCLKWITKPTTMKSLYSYFDVQAHLTSGNKPLRVWRFIKLYPELGVFQQPNNYTETKLPSTLAAGTETNLGRWAIGHYNVTSQISSPFAVCVIELNSAFVESFYDTTTNTLIIWLFAASLVDVDILNSSSEYPIAGVANGVPYGLNSGQTVSAWSRMITYDNLATQLSEPSAAKVNLNTGDVISRLEHELYTFTMAYDTFITSASLLPLGYLQRTHYVPFLGSTIYINGISSKIVATVTGTVTPPNIYIPFLCPALTNISGVVDASSITGGGNYFVTPILTAAWAQLSSFNSISKIGNYLRPNATGSGAYYSNFITYGAVALLKKTALLSSSPAVTYVHPTHNPILRVNLAAPNAANDDPDYTKVYKNYNATEYANKYSYISILKVYFNDFSKTSDTDSKKLNITAPLIATTAATYPSCFSFYLASTLTTDTVVKATIPGITDGTLRSYKSTANFYILGKPFVRMLSIGVPTAKLTPAATTVTQAVGISITLDSIISVSGIQRLPLSYYDSTSGTINIFNQIAIFFTSNVYDGTSANTLANSVLLTNLAIDTTSTSTTSLVDFVIYHPPVNTVDWTNRTLVPDLTTEIYKNDKASNIRFAATLPSEVPIGSTLTVSFGNTALTTTSVCGLVENGITGLVTPCTIGSSAAVCNLTKRASTINVCCYNVTTATTVTVVTGGNVSLPVPGSTTVLATTPFGTAATYTTQIYAPTTSIWQTYNITNPVEITSTTFFAKLRDINYTLTVSNGGFGRADFIIDLPRSPTRGMSLELIADITALQITNVKTRLRATFGASREYGLNMDEGDIFIEGVYTNFDNNGIKLQLKNMIYKCGIQLSKALTISLLPIKTNNYINLNAIINLKGADSFSLSYSLAHNVTSTPSLSHVPLIQLIQNDFCKITDIYPRVLGNYAEYTVQMDLKQYTTTLEGSKPNEILLFLPFIYYGGKEENIICYYGGSLVSCSFIDQAVISIRFSSVIPITGETPITVKIAGLQNPILALNNQVYFACNLNETDFIKSERKNLIRGTTTFSDGITYPTDVLFGNIRYINKFTFHTTSVIDNVDKNVNVSSVKGIQPLNPREAPKLLNTSDSTLHQLAFSLDVANRLLDTTTNNFTFDGTPYLIINFPPSFKLTWYTFTPQFKIDAYRLNEIDYKTIEQYKLLSIKSFAITGNMITLYFNEDSFAISKFHQYFILKMYNIPPPVETTVNTTQSLQTTQAIELTMTNTNRNRVFRTWTNLNSFAKEEIQPTKINNLLSHNKGFKYEFDQKKWIVDITDKDTQKLNYITLRTGRYMRYAFKVRSTSKVLRPLSPSIELIDNKFKLAQPAYKISTAANVDFPFFVGVACGETPGILIARPQFVKDTSEVNNIYQFFLPLSPVEVNILTDSQAVINFSQTNTVRINGSYFIDFNLSAPSFSDIDISFTPASESVIQNVKIRSGQLSARTVFRMTNKDSTDPQTYNMGTPSSTCYVYQFTTITFVIDGVAAIIPNDGVKPSNFEFVSSEFDTSGTLEKNSIKFIFNTEYTQIYIYAVLTCINLDFPTDEQMKTQNVTANSTTGYYSEILNISGSADIIFKNLIRGQPYKLKVFIESTQGDISQRTSSSMVIENYTLPNGTILEIRPTPTQDVKCASYRFNTKPGIQVKEPLRWYWQNKFSASGYNSTGCVTVIDQYGEQAPGLPSFKNNTLCGRSSCNFKSYQDSVVNQTSLFISETYILCAKPFPNCATDAPSYEERFNEVYSELNTNQTFKTILNIEVVPEFTLTSIADSGVPTLPIIEDIKTTGNDVSFAARSNGNQNADCAVITTSGATPTEQDFDKCETGKCTYVNVVPQKTTNGKISVSSGTTGNLSVFVRCKNEIPCASGISEIRNSGSATIAGGNNNNNNGTNNGTNNNNTNNGTNNSSRISVCLIIGMILVSFLLF